MMKKEYIYAELREFSANKISVRENRYLRIVEGNRGAEVIKNG